MDQTTVAEGKTTAIISYLTIIGLIVAFIMNNSKQNPFAKFHIGQSVRVYLLGAANGVLSWFLPGSLSIITTIVGLGVLVLIILGIVNAVNGKATHLPLIGTIGA